MIKKANQKDPKGMYFNENIESWNPNRKYDVVFSMETLYYFNSPATIINKIFEKVLNDKGTFIMGIDHYAENPDSLNWGKQFNLNIITLSINDWKLLFKNAGFNNIVYKQVEQKDSWNGTLIIHGTK